MHVDGPQAWGSAWCNKCNEVKKAILVPAVYMSQNCQEKRCEDCDYMMKRIQPGQQQLSL